MSRTEHILKTLPHIGARARRTLEQAGPIRGREPLAQVLITSRVRTYDRALILAKWDELTKRGPK